MFVLDREDQRRLDAVAGPGAGVLFARELESMYPRVLEEKTPARNGLALFQRDGTSVHAGAKTHTQKMFTAIGIAEWIGDYSQDLARVDLAAEEETFKVADLGCSYGWNIKEIKSAAMAGMPLTTQRGVAARRATEEKHNRTVWLGSGPLGLYGVLNYPYIPRTVLASAIVTATAADTIVAMINDLLSSVVLLTKDVARPTRVLMAPILYQHIKTRPRSTTTDTTILAFLEAVNPGVSFVSVHELSNDYHALGLDMILVDTPGLIQYVVPGNEFFEQLPAQVRNLETVINCVAQSGGVKCDYPLEARLVTVPAS